MAAGKIGHKLIRQQAFLSERVSGDAILSWLQRVYEWIEG